MKIKFIVMVSDVPERIENAKKIASQIPDCILYYGDNDNVFDKFINCFRLEPEYDGLVLLEDDIILCKDFYNRIIKEIEKKPDDVISFFESPLSKKELKSCYMAPSKFLYNQCNYYPCKICKLIPDDCMIDRFKKWYYKPWKYPSDEYVNYVLVNHGVRYYMKVPFLVQHLSWKSTWGARGKIRQTKYFIDDVGVNNGKDSD